MGWDHQGDRVDWGAVLLLAHRVWGPERAAPLAAAAVFALWAPGGLPPAASFQAAITSGVGTALGFGWE